MKKFVIVLLCLALLPVLAACGAPAETPAAPAPTEAPKVPEVVLPGASEETAAPASAPTDAPEETPAAEEKQDTAEIVARILEMKGQPVQDLIDWLGEPESRDYSSSCLVSGGQDGQLCYDGFTVYTLVEPDGTETIYDCE